MRRFWVAAVVACWACSGDHQTTPSSGGAGGVGGASGGGGSAGGLPADLKATSQSCDGPEQCESGFCPEGDAVCCDQACDQPCLACLASKTTLPNGTCGPVVASTDPDADCKLPASCDGNGKCCGEALPPTGGTCPAMCTGGCLDNECTIVCVGDDACADDDIVCPVGFACKLSCAGQRSCRRVDLTCPLDHACSAICGSGNQVCDEITVSCSGNAPCTLDCSGPSSTCTNAALKCGNNACSALCGTSTVTVECGSACRCDACG